MITAIRTLSNPGTLLGDICFITVLTSVSGDQLEAKKLSFTFIEDSGRSIIPGIQSMGLCYYRLRRHKPPFLQQMRRTG